MVVAYNKLVEQARARRLPKEAAVPGIATVTNFGTFGIEWATPILARTEPGARPRCRSATDLE